MEYIKKVLPHLSIILGGMMLTFVVIDYFNNARGLVNNDGTKALLLIFAIVSITVSVMLIKRQRRD